MTIKAAIIFAVFVGWSWGMYHYGTLQTKLTEATAVAKQEARSEVQEAKDTVTINQEAIAHDQAIAAAPDPTPALVCVRKYAAPKPVPAAAGAPIRVAATAELPKADSPGFDPGPKLTPIGRSADADIVRLQAYIVHVCLAPR